MAKPRGFFHGGVSFKPYRNEFNNIISNKNFKFYEVYNASEGFFGIQDLNDGRDLLLMLLGINFLKFNLYVFLRKNLLFEKGIILR